MSFARKEIVNECVILLEGSGYNTARATIPESNCAISFEGEAILGFLYYFDTPEELVEGWRKQIESTIKNQSSFLISAGEKSWNVYAILLTAGEIGQSDRWRLSKIEEDLMHSRKLVGANIQSIEDIESAIRPILQISRLPSESDLDPEAFLLSRVSEYQEQITLLFGGGDADQILGSLTDESA